jgi:heme-degrading monooxygenase HmoA
MVKLVITKLVLAKGNEKEFEEIQRSRFGSSNAKGSIGYALVRSEENPSVYYQIGFWETKADRTGLHIKHGSLAKLNSERTSKSLFTNKPKAEWFDVVARKEAGVLTFYGSAFKKKGPR